VSATLPSDDPARGPVVVIVPMPPSYRGGTEEYAYQLARAYSDARPVHIVTTGVRWKDGPGALSIGHASMTRLAAREMWERPVLSGGAAWRSLREQVEQAAVVQLHMPFPLVERRVTRWARQAGVPSVLTYHMDAEFGKHPEGLPARVVTGFYRSLSVYPALRRATAVISNSLGYAKASPVLSRFLPKVRVIYQGVDVERLKSTRPEDLAAVPSRTPGVARVLFIGRIVPYKGLLDLIQAVHELIQGGTRMELLIGGRGPQLDELKAKVHALGRDGDIRFLGFVPDGAVGALYAGSDLVACPSVSLLESTPITLQEAMAFGTPVLGTTLPGTEETVPDDGLRGKLVPPHDVPALRQAMVQLLAHGERSAPSAPRGWVETAQDYLKLFDELETHARGA
jgi:glycosyltransferase involved in cell wall biosynthesis